MINKEKFPYFVDDKFYGSPLSMTSQFYFCPVPFRMDTYSGCAHDCIYCCLKGTHINLPNGTKKKIENIKVGDIISSFNTKKMIKENSEVIELYKLKSDDLYEISLSSKTLCLTGEHPIYTQRGWIKVENLKITDKVIYRVVKSNMKKLWEDNVFAENVRRRARKRMIDENPMKDKDSVKKMIETLKRRHPAGENHYNRGNKRPDFSKFLKENNPMKNPKFAKKVLQKSRNTFLKKGVSEGQKRLYEILDKMGILYKKEYYIPTHKQGGCIFLDAAILDKKVNIEYDGHSRHLNSEQDIKRDKYLKSLGWKILRLDRFAPFNEKRSVKLIINFMKEEVHNPFNCFIKIYEIRKLKGNYNVYNFACNPNNNYFANEILVHNCFANNSNQKFISNKGYKKEQRYIFVKATKLAYVKKYLDVAFEGKPNTFSNQERIAIELLRRKVPIHFGGMSDPMNPVEKELGLTYKILELFKKYDYPIIFSTKGKLILDDKYVKLIKSYKNFCLQISLIDDRQEVIGALEPRAMTVEERLKAFEIYKDKWTGCRIQPFIIGLSESRIIPLLDKLKERNVNHVMVEGLKFIAGNKQMNKRISDLFKELTGKPYNLEAYYKATGAKYDGVDLELPPWRKYSYNKIFQRELKKRGMTFGCADNDLRFLGSSYNCCLGTTEMPAFNHGLKHNIGHAVFKAMETKQRYFDRKIIEDEWLSEGKFRMVMSNANAQKRYGQDKENPTSNRQIKELFDKAWEKGGKNSPCQMCNVNCLGKGCYKLLSEEELNEKLRHKGTQQTL